MAFFIPVKFMWKVSEEMQDLTMHMTRNYREHGSFKFEAPCWEISADKLATFNETYNAARRLGCLLGTQSLKVIRGEFQHSLDAIFSSLLEQCADEFEACFVRELKIECARLLVEELTWYVKQPMAGSVEFNDQKALQSAIQLQSRRHYFSCLPQSAVDELRKLAEPELANFKVNAAAGRLQREDLSVNSGPTVRAMRDVLNREFKALGVLDAVSAYTGRRNRVLGLALELSVPQASWWNNAIEGLERPPKTLYAHLDEAISYPKSIVYLSDVTEDNGPTSCYQGAYEAMNLNPLKEMIGRVVGIVGTRSGSPLREYYSKQYHQSMNSEKFRRHFMRLPESLRFNSHMGWDVAPESELENTLVSNEKHMTGPAGTFIIFDGARLLHRGGMVKEGERLALQVIFSDLTLTERVFGKLKRMIS